MTLDIPLTFKAKDAFMIHYTNIDKFRNGKVDQFLYNVCKVFKFSNALEKFFKKQEKNYSGDMCKHVL